MTAAAATARGQRFAERQMVDACTITRGGGAPTFDATTGTYTAATGSTVYTGKCRVKPQNLADRVAQAGERPVSLWPFSVSIPIAADADLDDVVTVTASADSTLVDRTFRVRSVARGTFITARRLDCEETSG